MADRYSFFMFVFSDLIIQCIGLLFYLVLYDNIASIKGWDLYEVLLIYGLAQLSYGLFGFLFWGLYDFGGLLVSGRFDLYLVRPMGCLFQLHIKGISNVGGLVSGIGTILFAVVSGHLPLGILDGVLMSVFAICGSLLYLSLHSMVAAMCFWAPNISSGILTALHNLISFGRYPITIYPRALQLVLTWIIPIAFTGFYPASFLLDDTWQIHILFLPVVTIVFLVITGIIWRAGVSRYESSGN